MRILHQKAAPHAHSNSKTIITGDTESCAAAEEESKVGALSEHQSTREIPPFQSPKRHRRRMESLLSKHQLGMSPQPRKEKIHHRRRANSWHGGSKLIHFFHHEREPAVPLDNIPRFHEDYPPENSTDGHVKHQSQTNMQRVDEEPSQQPVEKEELRDTQHHSLVKTTKGNPFSHFFKAVEDFLFQRRPVHHGNHPHEKQHVPLKKDTVLLFGCETVEEHYQKVKEQTERVRALHGKEGLRTIDLEYRIVHCDAHKQCDEQEIDEDSGADPEPGDPPFNAAEDETGGLCCTSESLVTSLLDSTTSQPSSDASPTVPVEPSSDSGEDIRVIRHEKLPCHWCMQRLFHIPSGLFVDEKNRKQFCADGEMYEQVTRLCQEYAQDLMCQEGNLEWHVVEAVSASGHKEDVRMMVSKGHMVLKEESSADAETGDRPTLMIATGRGKVRAGIFSRMHMMCSGLESATAIPLIREAAARGINIIVLDPNVHGDANGFVTFTKCMDHYFSFKMQKSLDETGLYVLSHSASGGHMARYLLDKSDEVLAHFHAIAFTDSTHNIQWTKKQATNAHSPHKSRSLFTVAKSITAEKEEGDTSPLQDLLESERCVYFRCANIRRNGLKWSIHPAGEPAETDAFWTHRFGKIRTLWAGTDEHSLTNWFSHAKIWEHFDKFLRTEGKKSKSALAVED